MHYSTTIRDTYSDTADVHADTDDNLVYVETTISSSIAEDDYGSTLELTPKRARKMAAALIEAAAVAEGRFGA